MQGFLLWARSVAENSFFRHIWRPLRHFAGLSQSQVLFSLARWFDAQADPAAAPLKSPTTIIDPLVVNVAVRALFLDPRIRELLAEWWEKEIRPLVKPAFRDVADETFRFDMLTLPKVGLVDPASVEEKDGIRIHRSCAQFDVDVPAFVATLLDGVEPDPGSHVPTRFQFAWRLGLEAYIDNHEEALLHMAVVERSEPVGSVR